MHPPDWATFASITGGASAALTGLVFVATSLNINRINSRGSLRIIAAQTMILLVMPLFMALAISVPDERNWLIGGLLVLCAVVIGTMMYLVVFVVHRDRMGSEYDNRMLKSLPALGACACAAVAGVSLAVGAGGGLLWAIPAVVLAFAGGVGNAWLLLLRLDVIVTDTPGDTI